jgi:putative tryptophan/tyrosine transport system substrate-binding protein
VKRRDFIVAVSAAWLAGRPAWAQARAARTVGIIAPGAMPSDPAQRAKALRDGMADLGWTEGRDVSYVYRYGAFADLDALARELVAAKVDVVVAFGSAASLAARRATDRVPIIVAAASDLLADGLVKSLARPGGNVTGVSLRVPDVAIKQLEILKEGVPGLRRVAIFYHPSASDARSFAQLKALASGLDLKVADYVATREADLPRLFRQLSGVGAIMVLPSTFIDPMRGRIGELAIKHHLPSMGAWRVYADAGFLFAYSARLADMQERAAVYVDKILKGARPGDLPVEQPSKFELVINLNTAWALGLTIPPTLLTRADDVIE